MIKAILTFFILFSTLNSWAEKKVDLIFITKSSKTLILVHDGSPVKRYHIALGPHPRGPKQIEGDGRTPEGVYKILAKIHDSGYHRALLISYPNHNESVYARSLGKSAGGEIMIHGIKNGYEWVGFLHRFYNWTQGCIAVTNSEIDEIWDLVDVGTPIFIYK